MITLDKHAGLCIKSLKKQVPVADVETVKDFDFAAALESVYPLLDIVFGFLDYRDLKNVAKISKSWYDTATRELKKRNDPSWVTCYKTKTYNNIECSSNLNHNNVGLGIILYNTRRIKLNNYVCVHMNTSLSMKTVVEYIADELVPENVEYCLISCPKVISHFPKTTQKKPISDAIFDGLFLPVIPNIRMAMFHCNPVKTKDLKSTISCFIEDYEEVKCLLMFCKNDLRKSIYNLLDGLLPNANPTNVAVGGGIIRGTKTFQQVNNQKKVFTQNDVFCITFIKNKEVKCDFDAYSVVITGDDLSKEEFEAELVNFKNRTVLRMHTAAFRICCSAKVDTDEELNLFSKVFPDVPLLGMDADGEIGWNCYNDMDTGRLNSGEIQSKRLKRQYPKVQHQWSTVVVLITWGKLLH